MAARCSPDLNGIGSSYASCAGGEVLSHQSLFEGGWAVVILGAAGVVAKEAPSL